ncbi:MAG: biotin/lipoyl-containing protein [Nocardioidaceae bacterium]
MLRTAGGPVPTLRAYRSSSTNAADTTDTRILTVHPAAGRIVGPQATVGARPLTTADDSLRLEIDGTTHEGRVHIASREVLVAYQGQTYVFQRPDAFGPGGRAAVTDGSVAAPMPGTVLAVNVTTGAPVEEGDTLGVLEAMKMELALKAPVTGVVTLVDARRGQPGRAR